MEKQKTVANLRKKGFKVRVYHSRFCYDKNEERKFRFVDTLRKELKKTNANLELVNFITNRFLLEGPADEEYETFERGGLTEIEITTPTGKQYVTESNCYVLDKFCHKQGVKIALGKKNLQGMWSEFFKTK